MFFRLSSPAEHSYGTDPISKYTDDDDILSKIYDDLPEEVRQKYSKKIAFDWKQFLNFNLIVFTFLTLMANTGLIFVSKESEDLMKRVIVLPSISILLLTLLARIIVYIKESLTTWK
jgi:hypothetical protein